MKLLTKTTLLYLLVTLLLFSAGGMIAYRSIHEIIHENISENLEQYKEQVLNHVKSTGSLPAQPAIDNDLLAFYPAAGPVAEVENDTAIYNEFEEEMILYRQLVFPVQTKEGWFRAVVGKPMVESEDLFESIADAIGIVAAILLAVLLLLNWVISRSLWKPFYRTLGSLREFDLNNKTPLHLPSANTSEFKLLNEEIGKMTNKIMIDYRSLKEFTENASHELQTPLAIIRSKLELMIQSDKIPQEEMKMIQDVYENTNRLSKLNQSLLLLAKIENRQFHETQPVELKALLEKKLDQFEDMITFKNITIEKILIASPQIKINLHLADILLSNILGNAIRHNINGGKIIITLDTHALSVSNSGDVLQIPAEKLFERFQKSGPSAESVGLGLSIVKQICDTYNYKITYTYSERLHTISLLF